MLSAHAGVSVVQISTASSFCWQGDSAHVQKTDAARVSAFVIFIFLLCPVAVLFIYLFRILRHGSAALSAIAGSSQVGF